MAEAIGDYETSEGSHAESGRLPLGRLLTGAGFLTEARLAEALEEGAANGERLGDVVVRHGWATEDDVAKLLADQWQLGYVERASIYFDADALSRLSREQAQRLQALPTRVQDGHVVVAVAEPTEQRLRALRAVIGEDTVVVVVPKTALDAGLRSDLLSGHNENGSDPTRDDRSVPPAPTFVPAATAAPRPDLDVPQLPVVVTPTPEPARFAPAVTSRVERPELDRILTALEIAAAEAAVLGASMGELAARLAELVNQASLAAERLKKAAGTTELTESLRNQLSGLTRTLESLQQ